MNGLSVSPKVTVNLTADQWDLYTYSYGAACDQAAHQLNTAIEEAVNADSGDFLRLHTSGIGCRRICHQ